MEILNLLRAKSKRESPENYLLVDHIKKTIKRASELWEFIERNKKSIEYEFLHDKDFFKNLFIALFLHDLGKINYGFQKEVFNKEERQTEEGEWRQIKEFFEFKSENNKEKKVEIKDHEVISILYSYIFLDNSNDKQKIRTAILLHHYNDFYVNKEPNIRYIFDEYPELEEYLDFLIEKKGEIKELLEKIIDKLIEDFNENNFIKKTLTELRKNINLEKLYKLKEALKNGYGLSKEIKLYEIPEVDENQKEWIEFFFFLGCLRRCDYSASAGIEIERGKIVLTTDVYNELEKRIKKNIKRENLWQEKILKEKDSKNLILVAPTGSGKTEFALLWAKNRGRKLIYTLPLRVALNDLFNGRFKKYFPNDFVDILHSTSFLEYLKGREEGRGIDTGTQLSSARMISSPIMLTTPDQVFLTSLKYYGFDKVLSVYPLSSVIIDEIQAYNPEMAAVVIKTLKMIKNLNGNVLIITATLPPYFSEYFKDFFQIIDEGVLVKVKSEIKNYEIKRHKIKLVDKRIFDYSKEGLEINPEAYNKIEEIVEGNKDKNILIIVNNVGKAIKFFKKFEEKFKERIYIENVPLLLHARIIENEKSRRIEKLKKALKNGKKGIILVSTQIVEASVDIDFDLLITEISPIDSQIQRWGRVWRNRGELSYERKDPNIYIFTNIEDDKGTLAIYHPKEVLEETVRILKKVENSKDALTYKEERNLIEDVFDQPIKLENGEEKTLKDFYIKKIEETLEWLKYYSAEKRSEAQRIFRNIAGIQVFVRGLEVEDEVYKALCEVLEDKENWKLPLESKREDKSIVGKVKNKINDENLKIKINKWEILKTLYSYSFNLPIYGFEEIKFSNLELFKGFFVLKALSKDDLKEIFTYGVNKIKETDLDYEEVKNFENSNML